MRRTTTKLFAISTACPLRYGLARSLSTKVSDRTSNTLLKVMVAASLAGASSYAVLKFMESTKESTKENTPASTEQSKEELVALNKEEWRPFKFAAAEDVTHDTKKFRFMLPSSQQKLGLPVASCILTRAPIGENGAFVVRPYTPVSSDDDKGYFELVVKNYPGKGVLSSHIHSLKPGDTLEVKGPIPKLPYSKNMKEKIGMIAGGTGITPMFQLIREILKHPDDNTEVRLLFANHTDRDILLKKELDELAARHKNFKVYYVLTTPPAGWTQGAGHISADMIKRHMPDPSDKHLILVCGPQGFYEHISGTKAKDYTQGELSGLLKDLGYTKEQVFKF